jgi:exodeoxyribonuclease VIII
MILEHSEREYFGRPLDFISPSDLKKRKTPKEYFYYKYKHERSPDEEDKEHFRVGGAAHVAILEQDKWKEKVAVFKDPYPKKTKAYVPKKQAIAKFDVANLGKTIITEKDFALINDMKRSLAKTMDISMLNPKGAIIEHSFYAKLIFNNDGTVERIEDLQDFEEVNNTPKEDLVLFICTRPDFIRKRSDVCINIDLKTCKSVNPRKFQKDSYELEYHIQAAMGVDIVGACMDVVVDPFVFIAIEKTPPYDALPFFCPLETIEYGRIMYQRRLWEIWKARKSGYFEGYSIYSEMANTDEEGRDIRKQKMISLDIPRYATDPAYTVF